MGNEEQPPLSEQGPLEQQNYYSWQYDQEDPLEVSQKPPAVPPTPRLFLPSQPLPTPPSSSPWPHRSHEPIYDMGTSLGYGQGMEYQYFDAPQPSQPIPQLRQQRLQQLREDRMRRQQRRMQPDATMLIPWGRKGPKKPAVPHSPLSSLNPPFSPTPPPASPLSPPAQWSPAVSLPSRPATTSGLMAAATPAQDTGMIQRVRIGRAALILTGAFVASRMLGLLRTSMFAFVFGTGSVSDAYLQAFLIPDLIFNIVAGGALSSAFIPVFTTHMIAENDQKTAWHIASSALNLALAVMMGLALIAILFARQLVPFYNPGIHDPKQLDLIASLTRIMLLQSVALGGGVIVTAVLNARQDFRLPAIGTVLYNVGLIIGLLPGIFLAFRGQRNDMIAVYGATWGVVLGALLQVAVQVPGLFKVGMHYTPAFDWRHPGVIQIGRQMLPRIINAAMLYASIFVDRSLILLLVTVVGVEGINGLITQYYQATQLLFLPLGIFGMAVSTAAFPTLSENVARGRLDRVRSTILETLRSIIFMSIPSSVGLIVLGFPIIQVLLQHGAYQLKDAYSTAVPLAFFAVGLTGLTAVEILTRSFYAMRDSTTPVIVSVAQFIFKIALSLVLINVAVWGAQWGMGALALSTSIAGLAEAAVLLWLLHQRLGGLQLRTLAMFIGRVTLAAVAMGLGLLIVRFVLDLILVTTNAHEPALGLGGTLMAFIKLLIELFVGTFIYIRGARMLGIEEMGPVRRVLDRLKLSWI
ncbi:MAG TPA: murein biosynthesis integral membrane protein MurJ [Ktedonobacteraceae bacterium]|nr:murein biosynthesis integral membrane protein MurJ [Ktedonobacteraceae bacterium]